MEWGRGIFTLCLGDYVWTPLFYIRGQFSVVSGPSLLMYVIAIRAKTHSEFSEGIVIGLDRRSDHNRCKIDIVSDRNDYRSCSIATRVY